MKEINAKDLDFEHYFQKKLEEDKELLKDLPYTMEQIKDVYRQEYEFKMNMPELAPQMEGQIVDYNTADYYLPEKWEMPRPGKLLYSDEDLQNVLKLLVYQLGIRKSLDIIPRQFIEQYLDE